ncbi:MAG: ribulose-phosphate 3-epimerase [Acetivibrionales bacterium]|jgi:ribulose-phosphate 3-epimerase|nr:ribulose-phosphate 3-epimerase [Bacillota bacterium]NLP07348.1 ribulose-phosphate 3-epimerase [Clostridiaceae bacterium]HOA54056.1 ribulose-phosphate 3-epimerase [Clostridiales bacterium]HPZ05815.1 ribulose-phosphate 3-epimerase [Clostridiales bacterium]HQD30208.1 ribulose-phosphate 3-epimerase [Clostridiales bacterium]
MIKIAPSILASDFSRLGEEILRVEKAGADMIHLDIMDGHFVPNITIGPPVIRSLRKVTQLPFDVHLMIEEPDRYIKDFADAGADIISVHVENNPHLHRTIEMIKERGVRASVVLNPATPLNTLDAVLGDVDMVLLMTVDPGFGGQQYIESMTDKIRELKNMAVKRSLKFDIEVDGGIDLSNIRSVTQAGANVIVAGTTIFGAPDAEEMISSLRRNAFGGYV